MSGQAARARSKKELFSLKELEELFPGRVSFQADMRRFTTLKVGGPADALVEPEGPTEVEKLLRWCTQNEVPWLVVGRGSNLVVRDGGIRGVVLRVGRAMAGLQARESKELVRVRIQAGCPIKRLLGEAVRKGWQGLGFMTGIPGYLGGAVAMNAGTSGTGMDSVVEELKWVDPESGLVSRSRQELSFGYRSLRLPKGSVILEATLALSRGEVGAVREGLRLQMRRRKATQPLGKPSAGSVFKNPPGEFAGRLIERAGLKGLTRGGAIVSEQHANFILNMGGARASDVLGLMEEIQKRVMEHSGVSLEPEVRIVGEDG